MKDITGFEIRKDSLIAGLALSSFASPFFYFGKIQRVSEKDEGCYVRTGGETFFIPAEDCVVFELEKANKRKRKVRA